LLLAPRPADEARATSYTRGGMLGASNKASGPEGRSPKGRGGEGRVSACCRASHLPTRRSRQNVNLFLREPLEPVLRAD